MEGGWGVGRGPPAWPFSAIQAPLLSPLLKGEPSNQLCLFSVTFHVL